MNIIIDVGANRGDFLFPVARKNPCYTIIGFEPIPSLINTLEENILRYKLDNVLLRNVAISNTEGWETLNVSSELDQGVSSLLDIDRSIVDTNDYWKKRTDLKFSSKIDVEVKTLENELSEIEFDRIKFIKIDVQGLDVEVLISLGKYLEKVDAGMLEVPSSLANKIYKGEVYDLKSALDYLDYHSFDVYKIKANDEYSNEFNVFFKRKGLDIEAIENELSLTDIDIYSGRDYWHLPGSKLVDYVTLEHEKNTDIFIMKERIHELETSLHEYQTLLDSIKNNPLTFFIKEKYYKIKKFFSA